MVQASSRMAPSLPAPFPSPPCLLFPKPCHTAGLNTQCGSDPKIYAKQS